jgi:AsmA family protein
VVSCVNVPMEGTRNGHRWRVWAVRTLGGVAALAVVLLAALWFVQDHLENPVIRYAAGHSQRQIRVDGGFQAILFSFHPRIVADGVTIGNPPWMPPGQTAEIGHLELTYELIPNFQLHTVVLDRATLHLERQENGHSNWQLLPPDSGRGTGPPLIHSLRMPNARVFFADERRRLKFDGTITAQDLPGAGAAPPLRIEGAGQLNGRNANFALNCDPLATVTRNHPYRFDFMEASSGTLLTGKGEVPKPFDFHYLDLAFESTGLDMKDLYFLTGLSLPETGQYHLGGHFNRQDHHLEFNGLQARSGQSDMHGKIVVDIQRGGAPSHTHADLRSKLLRMSDLGPQAAGRAPASDNKGRLLPDTPLQLQGARHSIAEFEFHADTLEIGHTPVRDFATNVKINLGTIEMAPLSGIVRDGKISGGVKVDVTEDVPRADVDLRVAHMKLLTASNGKPPSVEGPLQGRIALQGKGKSLHDLASNATGTVTAVLPHGAMRSSLAELAGFDLRGLGLMASGNKEDTGIRCGVASFDVKDGTLTSQRLLLDTDPVLITGEGTIDLDSEGLDLQLIAHPKHPRLRVRAPLLVRGTIRHPSFSIEAKKPLAQAGGAIALGVLLTPVAAMLAFVDPGLAKDSDCGALLAEVRKGEK